MKRNSDRKQLISADPAVFGADLKIKGWHGGPQ